MNLTLPDNFKQLSASQQAIYAAEALREATDSNLSGDNTALRKRVREHFGIATSTAERAEKLLSCRGQGRYPLAAQERRGLEGVKDVDPGGRGSRDEFVS